LKSEQLKIPLELEQIAKQIAKQIAVLLQSKETKGVIENEVKGYETYHAVMPSAIFALPDTLGDLSNLRNTRCCPTLLLPR
jgi:hypothetical protein